jgi:hypothetical protein
VVPGLLDGLGSVWRLVSKQLFHPHRGPASLDAVDVQSEPAPADLPALASPSRART